MYNDGGGNGDRYRGVSRMITDSVLTGAPGMAVNRINWLVAQDNVSSNAFLLVLDALMERKVQGVEKEAVRERMEREEQQVKDAARSALVKMVVGAYDSRAERMLKRAAEWKPREGKPVDAVVYEKEKGNLFVNVLKQAERKDVVLMAAKGLGENLERGVERMVVSRAMLKLVKKWGEKTEIMVAVKCILNDLVKMGEGTAVVDILPELGQLRDNPGAVEVLGSFLENERLGADEKREVMRELGLIGGIGGVAQLRKALDGEDAGLRLEAYKIIMGLSYLDNEGPESHLPVEGTVVEGALNTEEKPRTRIELIKWMGNHGKNVLVALEWLIGHETDDAVMEAAERASGMVMERTGEWNSGERNSDANTMPPGVIYVGSKEDGRCSRESEPTQAIDTVGTARWGGSAVKRGGAAFDPQEMRKRLERQKEPTKKIKTGGGGGTPIGALKNKK